MTYNVQVQTRYAATYTTPMTDAQTTMDVDVVPVNTTGFLTIRYGYSDQEDIYYAAIAGLQLTGLLRGLSPTASSPTEVIGLKRSHVINSPTTLNTVKMMTVHYIINDKASRTGDDVISGGWTIDGIWTFSVAPKMSEIDDANGAISIITPAAATAINYLSIQNSAANVYTPAFLTGGSSAQGVFGTWAAVTNGSFRITIDGVNYNVDGINFTGCGSMNAVATAIQTAICGVTGSSETVAWSTNHFIISSINTTASSAITATSTSTGTVGTDISGAGASDWMDSDAGHGTVTAKVFVSNSPIILEAKGGDTDIAMEIKGKGTGVLTIPDQSVLKTSAAPTANAQIANKKYVDDTFTGVTDVKVKVDSADTTANYLDNKLTVGTHLAKSTTNPAGNEAINLTTDAIQAYVAGAGGTNKLAATNSSNEMDGSFRPDLYIRGTYGDTVTAVGQLLYHDLSTNTWKLITSSAATWYYRLGIAMNTGATSSTDNLIKLQGTVGGQTFASIAPTFSAAGTGSDNPVGDAIANTMRAIRVDNSAGAECIVTGGTISAKQVGTPSGAMLINLVLEQQDQANTPACFRDMTNYLCRGAVLASASIAQALFSGTYAAMSFSFGGNIKIPAGVKAYLVISKTGAADGSNYYKIQGTATTLFTYDGTSATSAWTLGAATGNYTLTVTSTSPIGYGVKTYAGSSGSYGLVPTYNWSRVIGHVTSATEFYFNPEFKQTALSFAYLTLTSTTATGLVTVTTNFCPSRLSLTSVSQNMGTAYQTMVGEGFLHGGITAVTVAANSPESFGAGGLQNSFGDLGGITGTASSIAASSAVQAMYLQGMGAAQNKVYAARLENGFYLWVGYPAGANFVAAGNAGFSEVRGMFKYRAEI